MDGKFSRRVFLKTGLYGGAVLVLPAGSLSCGNGGANGMVEEAGRFFESHQYETVRAVTEAIIPEGDQPGAVTAGVADYIDFFLGAFKVDPPRIYAVGPFSGRHGGEGRLDEYLPLSRVKEIGWRNAIEGSQGIPEREFNGPVEGLQQKYARFIEALDAAAREAHAKAFKELRVDDRLTLLKEADTELVAMMFEHTVEGMYGDPSYGGNRDMVGWRNIDFEGDRQPIGYTRAQMEQEGPRAEGDPLTDDDIIEFFQMLL